MIIKWLSMEPVTGKHLKEWRHRRRKSMLDPNLPADDPYAVYTQLRVPVCVMLVCPTTLGILTSGL